MESIDNGGSLYNLRRLRDDKKKKELQKQYILVQAIWMAVC